MKIPLTPIRFLYRAARQYGQKTGVIEGNCRWTYNEYASRCHQLANLLQSWELAPGSRIAFLSYNSHHLLEAYYGVPLANMVLLPLNVRLNARDFLYILNDAGAEALFLHPDFLSSVAEIRAELRTVRKFVLLEEGESEASWLEADPYERLTQRLPKQFDFDVFAVDEDSLAELFYTSGTTGKPKGVMLTHRNLFLHALETALGVGCQDSDIHLHTIPLFHVNGWGAPQFLTNLGATHILLDKFEPERVLRLIQKEGVTTFYLVPTMATALLNYPKIQEYDLSSMRTITLGGSAANPALVEEIESTFNCRCVAGYGLTETSPVLTLSRLKAHLKISTQQRHSIQAMTGFPISGTEIEVVDDQDQPLPWDGKSVGEIVVRADGVMEGYWRKGQESATVLRNRWFHTGDMATIDPDGYVLIVDRKKDIIISGGENISSLEIEKALLSHPGVLECAVIAVPDPTWGEVPKALVVLKQPGSLDEKTLREHCRSRLAHFKCPQSFDFFESLPKGGTGKILKRELREQYWEHQDKRVH